MVRMVYLKRRCNHEIAVKTTVDNLPRHQQPTPPPQLITPPPLADTKVGRLSVGGKKGLDSQKTTHHHHHARRAARKADEDEHREHCHR